MVLFKRQCVDYKWPRNASLVKCNFIFGKIDKLFYHFFLKQKLDFLFSIFKILHFVKNEHF